VKAINYITIFPEWSNLPSYQLGHSVSSIPCGICFLSWFTTDFRLVVIAPRSNFKRTTARYVILQLKLFTWRL